MEERYCRNLPAFTAEEQALLGKKRVLVAGCGGLGGYLVEFLARLGVGEITVVDGDVFTETNLNRQLLSGPAQLGKNKALAAQARALWVNPGLRVQAAPVFLDRENGPELLRDKDLALDALDNVESRLLLETLCAGADIPLVHGAVRGWLAQVAVVPPGSGLLHRLYTGGLDGEAPSGCPPFTPAFCAAMQGAEAAKRLCGRKSALEGRLLLADLERMETRTLEIE